MAGLKKKLIEQIGEATGGPQKYTGKNMKDAHKGLVITDEDFDALVGAGLGGYATHVSADIPRPGPDDAVVTVTAKGDFPTFILWVDPGKGLTRLSLPLDVQVVMNRECFRPHESKPACA